MYQAVRFQAEFLADLAALAVQVAQAALEVPAVLVALAAQVLTQ